MFLISYYFKKKKKKIYENEKEIEEEIYFQKNLENIDLESYLLIIIKKIYLVYNIYIDPQLEQLTKEQQEDFKRAIIEGKLNKYYGISFFLKFSFL